MKAKVVEAENGIPFYVRVIEQGERYGHEDAAVWQDAMPGVIFYDFRFAHYKTFGPMGQQVATYYLQTIIQGNDGLNLDLGIPAWQIDAKTMNDLRWWLEEQVVELSESS